MHSRREEALKKTPRIKSSFSRNAKNCLAKYARNYFVRSARGPRGKPIRAESWKQPILAGSAMLVKLRDYSRHRNDLPVVSFRQRFIDQNSHTGDGGTGRPPTSWRPRP